MSRTFICAECEEVLPVAELSAESLALSGETSRSEAVDTLKHNDCICTICQDQLEDLEDDDLEIDAFRNDRERFEFDGLELSPARWQAHLLSY